MKKIEIIIVRHGTPEAKIAGWLRVDEFQSKVKLYNASSITDKPSTEVLNVAKNSSYVVCSNLQRSIDSAKALGYAEIDLADEIFAEAKIPYCTTAYSTIVNSTAGRIRLPAILWLTLYRVMSLFGFSLNGESYRQAKHRAKAAAERLVLLAESHEKVLVVGHGFINKLIARELLSLSWSQARKQSSKCWGYGVYEKYN